MSIGGCAPVNPRLHADEFVSVFTDLDADALGIYKALGLPAATVATLKGPRQDIIKAINLNRLITVADGFTGDVLTIDASIDSSFPTGRRLGGGTARPAERRERD